jgi:hypothetical protein
MVTLKVKPPTVFDGFDTIGLGSRNARSLAMPHAFMIRSGDASPEMNIGSTPVLLVWASAESGRAKVTIAAIANNDIAEILMPASLSAIWLRALHCRIGYVRS